MEHSKFKFRAMVDWLSFLIETTSPTKGDAIYRRFQLKNYVEPLDRGDGGAATRFIVTLQDVQSWEEAKVRIECIERAFPFARGPMLVGLEVSFDARARTATRDELIDLAANFYKFSASVVSSNRRFGGRFKGDVTSITRHRRNRVLIAADRVLNIGNQTDDLSQRVYFKTVDDKQPLPTSEHRARMELTLKGGAMPFATIRAAREFDFTALSPYFKFRRLKGRLNPVQAILAEASPQIGERVSRRRQSDRSTRMYSSMTRADSALNSRAWKALDRLTEQMRAPIFEYERRRILRLFDRPKSLN
ncbi:hypothetical protein AWB70_00510 [Caballeronia cordobensis]|uniref:Uncharacterized protein n=1 Tax=Caballeronia cordobensis TaxID=1353886 RepID=A0A158F4C0_CABCO|nr:hypothetical protein [Caballeronia cordobensis]SAL14199.1 hypothetical protein AWB70_00510 [Caballeronia cordobensis]